MRKYTKRCSICKDLLLYRSFPLNPDDTLAPYCLDCKEAYDSRKHDPNSLRERIRRYIRTIKATTPCADCGKKYHYCVMDFDHREGETKLFNLSSAWSQKGQDKVEQEVAKCDIVCSNCHRMRTYNRARHSKKAELATPPRKNGKLTFEQIDQIFKLHATGQYTNKQIAAWFGVDRSHISHILAGRTHKKYHRQKVSSRVTRETDNFSDGQALPAEDPATICAETTYPDLLMAAFGLEPKT